MPGAFAQSPPLDSDGGGIPDDYEYIYWMDPYNADDDLQDWDMDGLSNYIAYLFGWSVDDAWL